MDKLGCYRCFAVARCIDEIAAVRRPSSIVTSFLFLQSISGIRFHIESCSKTYSTCWNVCHIRTRRGMETAKRSIKDDSLVGLGELWSRNTYSVYFLRLPLFGAYSKTTASTKPFSFSLNAQCGTPTNFATVRQHTRQSPILHSSIEKSLANLQPDTHIR